MVKKNMMLCFAEGLVVCSLHAAQPAATALVTVDIAKELGPVKPMHAVNNGPSVKKPGGDQKNGNFEDYKADRIPFRAHARFDQPRLRRRSYLRHQRLARRLIPNAHMAVSIDQSEKEIHNRGKSAVGDRLAALALNRVYGMKDVVCFSPEYAPAEFKDGAAFVRFETEGSPLKAGAIRESYPWDSKHSDEIPLPGRSSPVSELEGFVIRDAEGAWHWADAWIVSPDMVRVTAVGVASPTAVRYAWGGQGFGNLVNAAGLPAMPFSADGAK